METPSIPSNIPLANEEMFRLAVRHRSAATDVVRDSYERLEFFGDSVLGLVIAQYLYEHHPDWDQGMMSKAKASVVQEAPLAKAALRLGLDKYIELSASEAATGGSNRPSILADILEAIIGCIYLESGLEKARWFVLEQLDPFLREISGGNVSPHDHKSRLQEVAQSIWRRTPIYRVAGEGPLGNGNRFHVQVVFEGEVMGEGYGRSKKEAEQEAALEALQVIERALRARAHTDDRDL